MRFRPLQINYRLEALNCQEEQLRSQFFYLPHVCETKTFQDDDVLDTRSASDCKTPPSFLTNISRRAVETNTAGFESSDGKILKSERDIKFIEVKVDAMSKDQCGNKENNELRQRDFIENKNLSLLTLQHSYHFKANDKHNKVKLPDAVFILISQQQRQRKIRKQHRVVEDTTLSVSTNKLLLPTNFIGCIVVHNAATSDIDRNDWLSKRKQQWGLQRDLIKAKRLTRRQMPWWYYYNYHQHHRNSSTESAVLNLTVLRFDMQLPFAHSDTALSKTTSTITREMSMPWIKSIMPSISAPKQQQEQQHHLSLSPLSSLNDRQLNEYRNSIFTKCTALSKETSPNMYESCTSTVGSAICIKKIMKDAAPPTNNISDQTVKKISDENAAHSIPSTVALASLIIPKKPTTCTKKENTLLFTPNNNTSRRTHRTNIITSKRLSEIMCSTLTPSSASKHYNNGRHLLMLLPHIHQQQGREHDSDNSMPMQRGALRKQSAFSNVDENYPVPNRFLEEENNNDEYKNAHAMVDKDICSSSGTANTIVLYGDDNNKHRKKESKLITDVKLQLMTGCCIERNQTSCAYYGLLSCDEIDASIYRFRYHSVVLRQNETDDDMSYMMVNTALRLQALYYVYSSMMLPSIPLKTATTNNARLLPSSSTLWLPRILLQNRRNLERIRKNPSSFLKFDDFAPLAANKTVQSLCFMSPTEFDQIIKDYNNTGFCLNAHDDWTNGKRFETPSIHDSVALREELIHLMTKAYELLLGHKSASRIFCDRRVYHHDTKGIEVEVISPPLPLADGSANVDVAGRNDGLKQKKRKPRQDVEEYGIKLEGSCRNGRHKKSKKKRRKGRTEKKILDQDFYDSFPGTTSAARGFHQAAVADDDASNTAPNKAAKIIPTTKQPYHANCLATSKLDVSPFALPRGMNETTEKSDEAPVDIFVEELHNGKGKFDDYCIDTIKDCNDFLSRNDMALFKIPKVTPMADHPYTNDAAAPSICSDVASPLLPVKKIQEQARNKDYNSAASGSEPPLQNFNSSGTQSIMDNFFNLMGRSRGGKLSKGDDYLLLAKGNTNTSGRLADQQPIAINGSAPITSNNEDIILLSEDTVATNIPSFHKSGSPISVLCSGHFMENFSEAVANLASGQWLRTFNESHIESGRHILLCDSPIVDFVGVDIELPDSCGIICIRLSQWINNQSDCIKTFTKRVLFLAATGRYSKLWIYVICDTNITRSLSMDLFILQNTLVMQRNCCCPCEQVTVYITSLHALPSYIAQLILEHPRMNNYCDKNNPEKLLGMLGSSRKRIQDRAIFLISMAPSFTALDALSCLHAYFLHYCDNRSVPSLFCVEQSFTRFLHSVTALANGDEEIVCRVKQIGASDMIEKLLLQLSKAMKWALVRD